MKAIECRLIIHGQRKEIDMGLFPSKAKAKQYMQEVSNLCKQPFSIKPITPCTNCTDMVLELDEECAECGRKAIN
jgi:hypothetical protein